MGSILDVTCFTDPGCPWAYSENPAFAVLRWRYGNQLRWRLVMIGLMEDPSGYVSRGYTPARAAKGYASFRDRYGMPFAATPRARVLATSPACRAIIATRRIAPDRELAALRALQFGWFNSTLLLDEAGDIGKALGEVAGLDVEAVLEAIDSPEVLADYEADKRETRTAQGGPTHFQGKARQTDGPVRFSAPSLVFEAVGKRIEAGGFQPVEAYDLAIANIDTSLQRQGPPSSPLAALRSFPDGLTTQEVAAIMAPNNTPPDRAVAEACLIELLGEGDARRIPVGDDALWLAV
jgi:2-hydroxychromene-2-carboxylate isomerase